MNNHIKNISLFKNLNITEIEKLQQISKLETFYKDNILYYEDTPSNYLYILVEGLAKSYKIDKNENEIFLYYIQCDDLISEISSFEDDNLNSYTNVLFIENSTVLKINYKEFKRYFLDTNILIKEFSSEIINRNKKLENLINREFIFDAVTKVTMMIESDLDMFNKLKRHDIALILHIQPATLSRVLNKLKKDGMIDIIHGKVVRNNYE
jgi:CRP/FNR family transcriptional regulator